MARSAEISRSIYVARFPGRGGTGAEQGRRAFTEYTCETDSWSGRDWCRAGRREALSFRGLYPWHGLLVGEGLVRSSEARSAESFAEYICGTDSWFVGKHISVGTSTFRWLLNHPSTAYGVQFPGEGKFYWNRKHGAQFVGKYKH